MMIQSRLTDLPTHTIEFSYELSTRVFVRGGYHAMISVSEQQQNTKVERVRDALLHN